MIKQIINFLIKVSFYSFELCRFVFGIITLFLLTLSKKIDNRRHAAIELHRSITYKPKYKLLTQIQQIKPKRLDINKIEKVYKNNKIQTNYKSIADISKLFNGLIKIINRKEKHGESSILPTYTTALIKDIKNDVFYTYKDIETDMLHISKNITQKQYMYR